MAVLALTAATAAALPVSSASAATCPCSIWPTNPTPSVTASSDSNPNELGVKFTADVDGTVTGVRFYKGVGNTGTHTGHLWSSTGRLLASATFTSETSTGWQKVSFATPVPIKAKTVYVASYFAPNGHYATSSKYFATTGADSNPLHALKSGVSGTNGVYNYRSSAFPASSYNATNYWVDVVFTPTTTTTTLTAPAAPTSVSATATSATQVDLTWSAVSGATSYTVQRATSGGTWTTVSTGSTASWVDTTVSGGTSYSYRVAASNSGGTSAWSAAASVTTPTAADTSAPSTPLGVSAVAASPTQVNVSWSASTDNVGVTGYRVLRGGTLLATVTTTSFSDSTVTGGTSYSYTVQALDAAGNASPASAAATVTTPSASTCSGVSVPDGASIQSAINAYPGGTTFCISGTHAVTTPIVPKSGDLLIGLPGSLIDGGNTAQVAIDGKGNSITNVTVRGLQIMHFATPDQIAAVGNNAGSGWVIENNEVAYNAKEGIQVSDHSIVRNNHVHHNGQLGITGYLSDYATVSGNEIDHNGASQYTTFEGGGAKFFKGTNLVVSGNYVHDNIGSGIWLDTDVVNSTVSGNRLADNADPLNHAYDIEIELTCNVTVSDNVITGTGTTYIGVMVSSSHDITVTGNTVSGTVHGIRLWMDSTRSTQAVCGAPSLNNNRVTNNNITLASGSSHTNGLYVYNGGAPSNVSFSGNVYHAPDCGAGHWQWYISGNQNYTFSQWTSSNSGMPAQDVGATCTA